MRTVKILMILLMIAQCSSRAFAAGHFWQKHSEGINESKVNCLFADPAGNFVLAGTDKGIYRKAGPRAHFEPVFCEFGNNSMVRQFVQSSTYPFSIYAATGAGVFESKDKGKTWANILALGENAFRDVNCVLGNGPYIYAGTRGGLFKKHENAAVWDPIELGGSRQAIVALTRDEKFVYAATPEAVYRIASPEPAIQKIYSVGKRQVDAATPVIDDEAVIVRAIKDIAVSENFSSLFIAKDHKILESLDQGLNWRDISVENLQLASLYRLKTLNGSLYAATGEGLFHFENGRWQRDISGLSNIVVRDAARDLKGRFYLAGDDGFYIKSKHDFWDASNFELEPTVTEVQRMAIEYANVDPRQIINWHEQARLKAFMPTLSTGVNRGAGEMYHWDSGPNPDVLQKGKDYLDWSASLSWDFGDLIWSSDQTTIDSRSKLMSELRQDIMDRVTRLYFERRKAILEYSEKNRPLQSNNSEKELRVEELTALIDGLTGGEFSRKLLILTERNE